MAFSRRLLGWAGPVKKLFKMDNEEPATRSSNAPPPLAAKPETPSSSRIDTEDHANGIPSDFKSALEQATLQPSVEEGEPEITLTEKMERAKKLYPGSKDWAKDEARLFEILYLRQDLPILPTHWNIDFRGFPIPENIFETSEEYPPIIYAHCKNGSKEFTATAAIGRLVDLTLSVRTLLESEAANDKHGQQQLRKRAAELIKEALDDFIAWAARDGGYNKLKFVPNIVAEIVEAPETQADVVHFMRSRMRGLAKLQQEFYKTDQSDDFWSITEPKLMGSESRSRSSRKKRYRAGMKRSPNQRPDTSDIARNEQTGRPPYYGSTRKKLDFGGKKRRKWKSPTSDIDELAMFDEVDEVEDSPASSVEAPDDDNDNDVQEAAKVVKKEPIKEKPTAIAPPVTPKAKKVKYRRELPVVYGFYILGTSVFLLTADSAKGDSGYISFQVDIDLTDNHQSVWNALTVAIAVCSARDELMNRVGDFAPAALNYDSDPDA